MSPWNPETRDRRKTVESSCPSCGFTRWVQPRRTGKLCKPCCNRRKSAARRQEHSQIYYLWRSMLARCGHARGANAHTLMYYRDLGISVCPEWANSCEAFYQWAVANGWKPGLTIDRIDPTKNYEPSNCQWITRAANVGKARRPYTVYPKEVHIALAAQ